MERVAVVGAAGFVGRNLAAALLGVGGLRITCVDVVPLAARNMIGEAGRSSTGERIEHVVADVSSADDCRRVLDGCDTVFHMAAILSQRVTEDCARGFRVNVLGAWNVMDACANLGAKLVLSSSASGVYGRPPSDLLIDESTAFWHAGIPVGTAAYGSAKLVAEYNASLLAGQYPKFRWVALRYTSVYGVGQHAVGRNTMTMSDNIDRVIAGVPPVVADAPERVFDYVHVRDVAHANLCAATAPDEALGRAYIVASGRSVSVIELARSIARLGPSYHEPQVIAGTGSATWPGLRYRTEAAERGLGFRAAVRLEDGLREMYALRKSGASGS